MIEVRISDSKLQGAASAGVDAFLEAVISAIKDAIGGQLTGEISHNSRVTKSRCWLGISCTTK